MTETKKPVKYVKDLWKLSDDVGDKGIPKGIHWDDLVAFGHDSKATLVSQHTKHAVSILNLGIAGLFSLTAIRRRIAKKYKSPNQWTTKMSVDISDMNQTPGGIKGLDFFALREGLWYIPAAKTVLYGGTRMGMGVGALANISFCTPGTKVNLVKGGWEATSPTPQEYKKILPALQAAYRHSQSWIRAIPHEDMIKHMEKAEEVRYLCQKQLEMLPGVDVYSVVPSYLLYNSDGNEGSQTDYLRLIGHMPILYEGVAWQVGISMFGYALEGHCMVTEQGDFIASAWCMRETPDKSGGIDLFTGKNNKHTLLTWCAGPMLSRFGTGAYANVPLDQGDEVGAMQAVNKSVDFGFAHTSAPDNWKKEYNFARMLDIKNPIQFMLLRNCYKRLVKVGKKMTSKFTLDLVKNRARQTDDPNSPFQTPIWVYLHAQEQLIRITNIIMHPYYKGEINVIAHGISYLRPIAKGWKYFHPYQKGLSIYVNRQVFMEEGYLIAPRYAKAFWTEIKDLEPVKEPDKEEAATAAVVKEVQQSSIGAFLDGQTLPPMPPLNAVYGTIANNPPEQSARKDSPIS